LTVPGDCPGNWELEAAMYMLLRLNEMLPTDSHFEYLLWEVVEARRWGPDRGGRALEVGKTSPWLLPLSLLSFSNAVKTPLYHILLPPWCSI
jgi:hypothetical protein